MASNILPTDEAMESFAKVKSSQIKWAMFKIAKASGTEAVVPLCEGDAQTPEYKASKFDSCKDECYKSFYDKIQTDYPKQAVFGIVDVCFRTTEGDRTKVVLIVW
jgi:hypothetical protein